MFKPNKFCKFVKFRFCVFSEFVFVAQWWAGSESILVMENPEDFEKIGQEHHIVVANHHYDIDWLALWILAERLQMLGVSVFRKSHVL